MSEFHTNERSQKRASQVLRLRASQVLFFATCRWQKLELAIAIFDESTIAACRCYFPDRDGVPNFLKLVLTSWAIANSSQRFSSNPLSHAIVPGDDKIQFYQSFANWLEYWSSGSCNFCFTKQTVNALIWTLPSQALLFTELLDIDKYECFPTEVTEWPNWR